MSRIRSHKYITQIYNSSICTKRVQIITKNLCNTTKCIIKPNFISILFQSAKFALITSTLISNREYIISSKTLFNGTNFYKTQKYVLLTRQYVITNVK